MPWFHIRWALPSKPIMAIGEGGRWRYLREANRRAEQILGDGAATPKFNRVQGEMAILVRGKSLRLLPCTKIFQKTNSLKINLGGASSARHAYEALRPVGNRRMLAESARRR